MRQKIVVDMQGQSLMQNSGPWQESSFPNTYLQNDIQLPWKTLYRSPESHGEWNLNMGGSSSDKLKKSNIFANLILDIYYTLPQGRQETWQRCFGISLYTRSLSLHTVRPKAPVVHSPCTLTYARCISTKSKFSIVLIHHQYSFIIHNKVQSTMLLVEGRGGG